MDLVENKLPIQKGTKGEDVKKIQKKLGLSDDGSFGTNTEKAVKEWQKTNGLPETGVVDQAMWDKLFGTTTTENNQQNNTTSGELNFNNPDPVMDKSINSIYDPTKKIINEKWTKSYTFYIDPKSDSEKDVKLVIWLINDLKKATESGMTQEDAQDLSGQYEKDDVTKYIQISGNLSGYGAFFGLPLINPKKPDVQLKDESSFSFKLMKENKTEPNLYFSLDSLFQMPINVSDKISTLLSSGPSDLTIDDIVFFNTKYDSKTRGIDSEYFISIYNELISKSGSPENFKLYTDLLILKASFLYKRVIYQLSDSFGSDYDLPENSVNFLTTKKDYVKPEPQPETQPAQQALPTYPPEKIYTFNVETKGFMVNPEIGTFSVYINEPSFYFSEEGDDFSLLDEEYKEDRFEGMDEESISQALANEERGEKLVQEQQQNSQTSYDTPVIFNTSINDCIKILMKILIEDGFTKEQAAGVCGNVKAESGFKFWNLENQTGEVRPGGKGSDRWDKTKVSGKNYAGSKYSGIGLCQWTYGRRYKMEKFVGEWLTQNGVSTKALSNGFFDTDPGLHGGGETNLESYLKGVPKLFEAQVHYLRSELKNKYPRIIEMFKTGNPTGNSKKIFQKGWFVNASGSKVSMTAAGYAEIVVCDFEVPGVVTGSSMEKYQKTAKERGNLANQCLSIYNGG